MADLSCFASRHPGFCTSCLATCAAPSLAALLVAPCYAVLVRPTAADDPPDRLNTLLCKQAALWEPDGGPLNDREVLDPWTFTLK